MTEAAQRLGAALADRYRIERELGAGGMATVYLAEDVKHDRKVAIKVLRPELAAVLGAERFVQEIKTTASLQHPHILPLFDSGTAGSADPAGTAGQFLYYVMPYIEGETIREKLDRETQFGIDEALRITTEVADALDYAHRNGVIHRDIKPENILLHDGRAMVMDFGIALAVSAAAGGRMTETGLSLGTPHYMSPEQATADKQITARSDVYSLASVLYEMLTGDPPHTGSSAQQIIMKIIAEPVQAVTALRKSVPPNVAAALGKALEKLPADRFDTAKAFTEALASPAFRTGVPANPAKATDRKARALEIGWLSLALVAGIVLGRSFRGERKTFDVGLPFDAPMEVSHSPVPTFAVSPDGSFLVYLARETGGDEHLWYLSLKEPGAWPIPGAVSAAWTPVISPDGTRIAFLNPSGGGLQVAPITGGPVSVVSQTTQIWAGAWGHDDILFYADDDGAYLRWVDPETGPIRDLAVGYCNMPTLLSESQVICGGGEDKFAKVGNVNETPFTLRTVLQTTAGGDRVPLRGSHFRLFDREYLVYTSLDATMMATKFVDHDSLIMGRSVALVPGVRRSIYTGAAFYDVSNDGTLVYAPGANMEVTVLVRRTLDGKTDTLPGDAASHLRFNISPDGLRMASVVEGIREQELRVYDLGTGNYDVLAEAPYLSTPFWGSDSRELVYQRERRDSSEVVLQRLNRSESPRVVVTLPQGTLVQYVDSSLMLVSMGIRNVVAVDATVQPATVDTVIQQEA